MSLIQFWKEIVITQLCTGSVSFIASSVIVTFIALNGLSNPYRRIIFGLSISDIFQSFGIIGGPFLNRSDTPQALWGIGNKHSCQFVGFLFLVGMTAVPMYTLCLCIYYVCKLKGRMTDEQFVDAMEWKMHIAILFINTFLYITALSMDAINPSVNGNLCLSAAMPTGCRQNPEWFGECDPRTENASNFFLVSSFILPVVCLVGIMCSLVMLFWNVIMREKIFGRGEHSLSEAEVSSSAQGNAATTTMQRNRYLRRHMTTSSIENSDLTVSHQGCDDANANVNASVPTESTAPSNSTQNGTQSTSNDYREEAQSTLPQTQRFPSIQEEEQSDDVEAGTNAKERDIEDVGAKFPDQDPLDQKVNEKETKNEALQPINERTRDRVPQLDHSVLTTVALTDTSVGPTAHLGRDPGVISSLYKRELVTQACCYTLVFLVSSMPWLLVNFVLLGGRAAPRILIRACAFFYPLGGFFNIVVYTRPNVASFRRRHPECSRLQAFWLVFKAGGEMPNDDDWTESSAWKLCDFSSFLRRRGGRATAGVPSSPSGPTKSSSSLPRAPVHPPVITSKGGIERQQQESISEVQFGMKSKPILYSSCPSSDRFPDSSFERNPSSLQDMESSDAFKLSGWFY